MNDFPFLTTTEAADWLGVHQATVQRWCNSGELPCQYLGQDRAIHRDDVKARMEKPITVGAVIGDQQWEIVEDAVLRLKE